MQTTNPASIARQARIGALVAEARRDLCLSQEEVAERVGVTAQTITAIERGIRGPGPETTRRLNEALGLALDVTCPCCGRGY